MSAWVGVSSAWVGISSFYPRRGALRTRTRRQQQARRAKRSKRTTPPHAQLAAPLHVRAHIAHRARTAGVARRRPWNSRFREAKQEEPTSATTGTSATCVARLACAACMRGAACAAARRPPRRAARVCVSVDPRAPRSGGGERGTGTHHPHHHPRACVRTYLREVAPTCDVPRLARARPPCVTELTAQQRTWTGRDGGREGRSAVTSTASPSHPILFRFRARTSSISS